MGKRMSKAAMEEKERELQDALAKIISFEVNARVAVALAHFRACPDCRLCPNIQGQINKAYAAAEVKQEETTEDAQDR